MGYVYADPPALESLSHGDRCATPAERVEHDITLVATGPDDAFEQRLGFLCRIAETFTSLGVYRRKIYPHVLKRNTRHLIKIANLFRYAIPRVAETVPDCVGFPILSRGRRQIRVTPFHSYSYPPPLRPAAVRLSVRYRRPSSVLYR